MNKTINKNNEAAVSEELINSLLEIFVTEFINKELDASNTQRYTSYPISETKEDSIDGTNVQ